MSPTAVSSKPAPAIVNTCVIVLVTTVRSSNAMIIGIGSSFQHDNSHSYHCCLVCLGHCGTAMWRMTIFISASMATGHGLGNFNQFRSCYCFCFTFFTVTYVVLFDSILLDTTGATSLPSRLLYTTVGHTEGSNSITH